MNIEDLKKYLEYNHPLIFTQILPSKTKLMLLHTSTSYYKPIIGSDDKWYTNGIITHLKELLQKEGFEFYISNINNVVVYKGGEGELER